MWERRSHPYTPGRRNVLQDERFLTDFAFRNYFLAKIHL